MLFCILRCRRFARSTAFEVAGNNESSRKVNAFSRFGDQSFLSPQLLAKQERAQCCKSFDTAVQFGKFFQGSIHPAATIKQAVNLVHDCPQGMQLVKASCNTLNEPLFFGC
jgi:hypothetical protein